MAGSYDAHDAQRAAFYVESVTLCAFGQFVSFLAFEKPHDGPLASHTAALFQSRMPSQDLFQLVRQVQGHGRTPSNSPATRRHSR